MALLCRFLERIIENECASIEANITILLFLSQFNGSSLSTISFGSGFLSVILERYSEAFFKTF